MNSWIIIVDDFNSAIGIAARNRFKDRKHTILSANQFSSFSKLMQMIENLPGDAVLFAWRQPLVWALFSSFNFRKFRKIFLKKLTFLSLVDHMFSNQDKIEQGIFNLVDFYFVTSERLFAECTAHQILPDPLKILHDLPDYDTIRHLKSEKIQKRQKSIIWVGNSNWGEKQGYQDHKGYERLIKPLFQKLESEFGFFCAVVNSADGLVPNIQVLNAIAQCEILIQTSASEGTGLPVVEAIGLGTTVLTTKVGIADEFRFPSINLLDQFEEVEDILERVLFLQKYPSLPEKAFDEFISESLLELPELLVLKKGDREVVIVPKRIKELTFFFKWKRRWLLTFLRRLRG